MIPNLDVYGASHSDPRGDIQTGGPLCHPDPAEVITELGRRYFDEAETPVQRTIPRHLGEGREAHPRDTGFAGKRDGVLHQSGAYPLAAEGGVRRDLFDQQVAVRLPEPQPGSETWSVRGGGRGVHDVDLPVSDGGGKVVVTGWIVVGDGVQTDVPERRTRTALQRLDIVDIRRGRAADQWS